MYKYLFLIIIIIINDSNNNNNKEATPSLKIFFLLSFPPFLVLSPVIKIVKDSESRLVINLTLIKLGF